MGTVDRFDNSLSAGGIVMIVIAAIGVLTAFTTIICLFVTSKRRSRLSQRIESAASRTVTSPRSPSRPHNLNVNVNLPNNSSPHVRTILPMFPELGEFSKYPPSYDEAMRMSAPTTPITPNPSRAMITPSGTPPPIFEEAQAHPLFSVVVTPSTNHHLAPPTLVSGTSLKNNDSTNALETISTTSSTNSNNNENTTTK